MRRRHSAVTPATSFGVVWTSQFLLPGIHPLGRVAQEAVLADDRPGLLEDRADHLLGRARVGRGLQDHQLARRDLLGDGLGRRHDVGQVGRAGLRQRGGDADRQRVEGRDHGVVGRGLELAVDAVVALGRDVDEVRALGADVLDALAVEIDADDLEAGFGEGHGQRQAGIAEAHDAHARGARRDALIEDFGREDRRFGQDLSHAAKLAQPGPGHPGRKFRVARRRRACAVLKRRRRAARCYRGLPSWSGVYRCAAAPGRRARTFTWRPARHKPSDHGPLHVHDLGPEGPVFLPAPTQRS